MFSNQYATDSYEALEILAGGGGGRGFEDRLYTMLGASFLAILLFLLFWICLGVFRNFGYYRMAKKVNVKGAGFIFFPLIWCEPIAGLMKQSYRFYKRKKLDLSGLMFFCGVLGGIFVFLAIICFVSVPVEGILLLYVFLFFAIVANFVRTVLVFYAYYWIFKNYFPRYATVFFVCCVAYSILGGLIFSALRLWIIPVLCPDLFWAFVWFGSGKVPVSVTGKNYGEDQPSWEEWEESLGS